MVIVMAKRNKDISSESELKKLIEDTRKLRKTVPQIYNPTINLIVNGTEIANHVQSGFPKFSDIIKVLEQCTPKYRIITVVNDSSLRYLLEKNEVSVYEEAIKDGIKIKTSSIPITEVSSIEDSIKILLKLALENNAKILSNEDLLASYELIKNQKPKNFENKEFLVNYSINNNLISIFDKNR